MVWTSLVRSTFMSGFRGRLTSMPHLLSGWFRFISLTVSKNLWIELDSRKLKPSADPGVPQSGWFKKERNRQTD